MNKEDKTNIRIYKNQIIEKVKKAINDLEITGEISLMNNDFFGNRVGVLVDDKFFGIFDYKKNIFDYFKGEEINFKIKINERESMCSNCGYTWDTNYGVVDLEFDEDECCLKCPDCGALIEDGDENDDNEEYDETKELLLKLYKLAKKASNEVYDDGDENGTKGILDTCDELVDKIGKHFKD